MPNYRRAYQPGGTFFFTLVTAGRRPLFHDSLNRRLLHDSIAECARSRPIDLVAIVLLPDHLHAIWTLPDGDADFSIRWAGIKANFTRQFMAAGGSEAGPSRRRGGRAVWQERFWEHVVRDETDFNRHLDYIHFNPVKHGLTTCPHSWEFSSFNRWVAKRGYDPDWLCSCKGRLPNIPDFSDLAGVEMDE